MSYANQSATTPRVLVVDDDPRSLRLLEGYLAAEGYRVRCVDYGGRALDEARSWDPDVVLLDVMMPGVSGLDVCQSLKADPQTRLAQVMLVTALRGTPDMVQGLDTGADDYLTKPVRREELLAKLRALLRARRLVIELERAREQLAVRNRELELKKTLAHTLVHDLKNPLAVVLGNLDLLKLNSRDRALRLVERCHAAALRMKKMVVDLLDVETLEAGRYRLDASPVDVARMAREAFDDAVAVHREHAVTLTSELPGTACPVVGDPALLRRVVDNLIANGVARSGEKGHVQLRVAREGGSVEMTVSDDGAAIPADCREDVFDKYAKLQLREAGLSINRGLGLTFARLVVEAHGGGIAVEDAGEGRTAFRVRLPVSGGEDRTGAASATG